MNYISLRVDITKNLPPEVTQGEALSIAAWVFVPKKLDKQRRPTTIALLNGGSYDKRYFHIQIPGKSGYSMAEHLCNAGNIVILLDHLGIGESSKAPDQMLVTRQVAALANHTAVVDIYQRLSNGTLDSGVPSISNFLKVGGGHSMGGFQTITQQANHETYDAVMILGYTVDRVVGLDKDQPFLSGEEYVLDRSQPDYIFHPRKAFREKFHWGDEPDDVLAADEELLAGLPFVLNMQCLTAGVVVEDASRINVPVYIAMGQRDISPNPHKEPSFYSRSPHVTVHIIAKAAHCHNFSNNRRELFDGVVRWVNALQ